MTLDSIAEKEKSAAALSSVVAAVGLTGFKIVVGILTGSLGILAEAAHSGLDLVAALVTFLAVRLSGKPADSEHPFGHGKIENLSALFETLLLLGTCVWIIYEAIQRLFFKQVLVEASIWGFIVMGISIIIDVSRSRMLYRVARKHNSQALEADALHFSTDIWSSSVVILGLIGVWVAGKFPGLHWLHKADSLAALGVALIVIFISAQLGIRTIKGLLDTAPSGAAEKIKASIESLPGVSNAHDVRVRYAGPIVFVDAHVTLDGGQTLTQAHSMIDVIENTVRGIIPGADVNLHPEPAAIPPDFSGEMQRIATVVQALPGVVNCHDVNIFYTSGHLRVDAHVLLDGAQSLDQAHALTDTIEQSIQSILPTAVVTVHPEPAAG